MFPFTASYNENKSTNKEEKKMIPKHKVIDA